jgi:hypothetical protein
LIRGTDSICPVDKHLGWEERKKAICRMTAAIMAYDTSKTKPSRYETNGVICEELPISTKQVAQ